MKLVRSFLWRRMLEEGRYRTVTEPAEAEKVNQPYLCRVLRLTLTLLAPDIVEAILEGRQPEITLPALMGALPEVWEGQRAMM